ncbi:MAG: signal transduction histidine kinase [Candidatus Pseudothioglobus sp.]|jgi:signal transduction histidine kinase
MIASFLTPKRLVSMTLTLSLLVVFMVLWAANRQPHFDVALQWDATRAALVVEGNITTDNTVVLMSNAAGDSIALHKKFLTALPKDRRDFYRDKQLYFDDRAKLYYIANSDQVTATLASGDTRLLAHSPAHALSDRSSVFWLRLSAGLVIWVCGLSVWMWQPMRPELAALGLSSTGLMVCATGQALYAEIPNIFSPQLDWWLNFLVNAGLTSAVCFAVAIFFYYPIPLRRANRYFAWLGGATPLLIMLFLLLDWQPDRSVAQQTLYIDDWELYATILAAFVTAIAILVYQWVTYRKEKAVASVLKGSLMVIILGPGMYALFRALPSLFGIDPVMSRDVAWVSITLLFLFVVAAVARLNLFNLHRQVVAGWYWIVLGAAFLAMDLFIVVFIGLGFEREDFYMLLPVLVVYIPLRQFGYQRLSRSRNEHIDPFPQALAGLLKDTVDQYVDAATSWRQMLVQLFDPLVIHADIARSAQDRVASSGTLLAVSANRFSASLQLEFADQGTRQFGRHDVKLVKELRQIFERLWEYEEAFRKGQFDERKRLRRDLHDHVGHKLLTMIHAAPDKDMRLLAEDAMTELGASIKNIQLADITVEQLGGEIGDCLEAILGSSALTFSLNNQVASNQQRIAGEMRHGLQGVLRESISNVLRHANASEVRVDLSIDTYVDRQNLRLTIQDNGKGFDEVTVLRGDGLRNIHDRIVELGGTATWYQNAGTCIVVSLPLVVDRP